jgi:hypothetical protein
MISLFENTQKRRGTNYLVRSCVKVVQTAARVLNTTITLDDLLLKSLYGNPGIGDNFLPLF